MRVFRKVLIIVFIISFSISGIATDVKLPETSAGKMLSLFLGSLENGNVESFVIDHISVGLFDKIPKERQIRFLKMIESHHGTFSIFKISLSTEHEIKVIGIGIKSKAWRRIEIRTDKNQPGRIIRMDINMASPPENYFNSSKKTKIERPDNDGSIIKGEIAQKIDRFMTRIESIGFSGALGIVKAGEVILAKGYGYADREKKKVFNRDTVFTIGSITKQFTGAALVKLESIGKISFSDTLSKFFKEVPDDKKNITVHQLLTHTGGFPGAIGSDYEIISREDFIRKALKSKLNYKPGERYSYSNVGFSIAGIILEKLTGNNFETFLNKNILVTAGLAKTGYVLPDWQMDDLVVGYNGKRRWGTPMEKLWGKGGPGWHLKCNGGILTTIDDMLKWGMAILGDDVFSKSEKKKYLTPYVPEGPEGDSYYAYGWVRTKSSRGTDVITHNGGNPYIQNDMYIYPEEKIIVYITSNNGQFSAIDQSGNILRLLFNIR